MQESDRFDEIVEVQKFNPYHDARGRFSSANSATSFTYSPGKSKAHDNAIARAKERGRVGSVKYDRISYSALMGKGTKEEQKKKNETIRNFMNEAKIGDVYSIGGGFGSAGSRFEIVSYNRSPNKMGIKDGSHRTIAMSRENVLSYIKNGAVLVSQKTQN